ncbi:MAG: hypothetical protein HY815_04400 [Candidatus Riflebacteria bacterium]|nr:hypothetical protein [Candidatus Riflebacteria bacterium]
MIMKHVGMNVASDPAHYSGYTGVRGGMVVLVGADPGATCSTGEFDVRFLSLHTHLPILEPGDFQETVDATRGAFELSEHLLLPVMVIVPARLCYGMGTVTTGPVAPPRDELSFARTPDLTVVGQRAVERHRLLMEKIERLRELPPDATLPGLPADRHRTVPSRDLIVASGVIRDLVLEAMAILGVDDRVSVYAPALTYPLSGPRLLGAMGRCGCERVLFVEDLEGFLETQATATLVRSRAAVEVHGKDVFRPWGVVGFREVLDGLRRSSSGRATCWEATSAAAPCRPTTRTGSPA